MNVDRKTVIYTRIPTELQPDDLQSQVDLLKNFCSKNGYQVDEVYQDIASGMNLQNRTGFFKMLDEIIHSKIERVIITYKDRLSRIGFELFSNLFKHFGCEIIVVSEAIGHERLDSKELVEEIMNLLQCYSMKTYSSKRFKNKLFKLLEEGNNDCASGEKI